MTHTGWQISTLQIPEIIQLDIYVPFSEQNTISALSETLALARTQKIDKVLIDKRRTVKLSLHDQGNPLDGLIYQLVCGQSKRTALLFSVQQRGSDSVLGLMQDQMAQPERLHCFFDRDQALRWLAE